MYCSRIRKIMMLAAVVQQPTKVMTKGRLIGRILDASEIPKPYLQLDRHRAFEHDLHSWRLSNTVSRRRSNENQRKIHCTMKIQLSIGADGLPDSDAAYVAIVVVNGAEKGMSKNRSRMVFIPPRTKIQA